MGREVCLVIAALVARGLCAHVLDATGHAEPVGEHDLALEFTKTEIEILRAKFAGVEDLLRAPDGQEHHVRGFLGSRSRFVFDTLGTEVATALAVEGRDRAALLGMTTNSRL